MNEMRNRDLIVHRVRAHHPQGLARPRPHRSYRRVAGNPQADKSRRFCHSTRVMRARLVRFRPCLRLLQAIILGIVQGLTEFLPVSSSGHLLLGQYFLGVNQARFGLSFDAAIHTGTVLAVVSYFWRDLVSMARAFLPLLERPELRGPGPADGVPDHPGDHTGRGRRAVVRGLFCPGGPVALAGGQQPGPGRRAVPRGRAGGAQESAGLQAELQGGAGYRVRPDARALPWRLEIRGDDYARAVPRVAEGGGGAFLLPDERPDHRGGRGAEPHRDRRKGHGPPRPVCFFWRAA